MMFEPCNLYCGAYYEFLSGVRSDASFRFFVKNMAKILFDRKKVVSLSPNNLLLILKQ